MDLKDEKTNQIELIVQLLLFIRTNNYVEDSLTAQKNDHSIKKRGYTKVTLHKLLYKGKTI